MLFLMREGIAHGFGIGLGLFAALFLCSFALFALSALVSSADS
jgi:hypothetical protein